MQPDKATPLIADCSIGCVSQSESAGTSEQATNGRAPSSASHSSFSSSTQCLRFETITDRESRVRNLPIHLPAEACIGWAIRPNPLVLPMQRAILLLKLVVIFGDAGTSVLISVRRLKNAADLIVMNRKYLAVMAVINGLFFLSLVVAFALWAWRVAESRRSGMKWTKRRAGAAKVCPACNLCPVVFRKRCSMHTLASSCTYSSSSASALQRSRDTPSGQRQHRHPARRRPCTTPQHT